MIAFEYEPLPVFVPFHQSRASERLVVGGYGSGKSHAAVAEFIAWGLEQPGGEFLVTRKTVPALKVTTEARFVELLPLEFFKQCIVKRAGGHIDSIEFPNGSLYYFRGMDGPEGWKKLRSLNLTAILYDEADEFTQDDIEGMASRLRQVQPRAKARELGATSITRRGAIFAANPQGKNFLYYKFVDPEKRQPDHAYFTSSSLDNPFLPFDYIDKLLAYPDPWVRRYVLCSFDDLAGAIYEEWAYESHVVKPFLDVHGRPAYDPAGFFTMTFDPGTSSGNAALWCYYDKATHRIIGVAEYNETGLAASVHAAEWRKIEARHKMRVRTRLGDPKALPVRDRGTNVTLTEQYRRLGFSFQMATNDVNTRVQALGQLIHLKRFVVTSDCPRTFEQLQRYRWEDLTPRQVEQGREAKPLKKDVDLVDCAQYAACRWISPPKHEVARTAQEAEAYEVSQAIRKQLRAARSATQNHSLGTIHV